MRNILNGNYLHFSWVSIIFFFLFLFFLLFDFGLTATTVQKCSNKHYEKHFHMIIFESNKTCVTWKISPSIVSGKKLDDYILKAAFSITSRRNIEAKLRGSKVDSCCHLLADCKGTT